MNEQRDLGVTLVSATILMLSLVYLAQCSSHTPVPAPGGQASAAAQTVQGTRATQPDEHKAAGRDEDEESVRVKNIGHAIQTIGADPELRKTYGVNQ